MPSSAVAPRRLLSSTRSKRLFFLEPLEPFCCVAANHGVLEGQPGAALTRRL